MARERCDWGKTYRHVDWRSVAMGNPPRRCRCVKMLFPTLRVTTVFAAQEDFPRGN